MAALFGLLKHACLAKIAPELVVRDEKGNPMSFRYEELNAMLLNEFLKEHRAFVEEQRKVQEQGATIAQLKTVLAKQETIATQQQREIEALTECLQKVSAQLELNKAAPQTVLNNP